MLIPGARKTHTSRFKGEPPSAILPSPPFSWESVPSFSLKDDSKLAQEGQAEYHSAPLEAFSWSDSIRSEILTASSTVEAVSLVSLCRQFGRFKARVQFMTVALIEECLSKSTFPPLDLEALFTDGIITTASNEKARSTFCSIPEEYYKFLPPVMRTHAWEEVHLRPVVDSDGICYLVLLNDKRENSKKRKAEFDGMQSIVEAIWEEGRVDLFELPICCSVEYLCFRVIAAPMEMWLRDEETFAPFLTPAIVSDPELLSGWEKDNSEISAALRDVASHLPLEAGTYPVSRTVTEGDELVGSLLLSVNRQRLVLNCPLHLGEISTFTEEGLRIVVSKMTNFECLTTSPVAFRRLLRENGISIRDLGKVLLSLALPALKRIVVQQMLSRAAKWFMRRELGNAVRAGSDLPGADLDVLYEEQESVLLKDACEYFRVPLSEVEPFMPQTLDPLLTKFFSDIDFVSAGNRSLFPHANLLQASRSGHFPDTRFICPRPVPKLSDPLLTTPLDSLPLRYAANIFELELLMAGGDLLNAVGCIGELVDTILRMKDLEPIAADQEHMRLKVLALCDATRSIFPSAISLPPLISSAIIRATSSVKLYKALRREIVETEGPHSVSLLSLDSLMAAQIYEEDPELAVRILTLVIQECERELGVRNPVTISSYIRKGQAVKRVVEANAASDIKKQQESIQDGVRCLNKALNAVTGDTTDSTSTVIDQVALAHHLLAILHLWNGETSKAVRVSRDGVARTEKLFGVLHPRYLNAAFLHAKLLENYAASIRSDPVEAVSAAREAVAVLEALLSSLQDLSVQDDNYPQEVKELTAILGEANAVDDDIDMKRKLAITSILLKLNVWLLDPALSADLFDLVVSDRLSGSRGVLVLPNRAMVKEFVTKTLLDKISTVKQETVSLPILELSATLPAPVLTCCQMALVAKSKGMTVSGWFKSFCDNTLRTLGDPKASAAHRDLLNTLFLTFAFVSSQTHGVYVGPISQPIVPPKPIKGLPTSGGIIYRGWEHSATLYCLDHGLYKLPRGVGSSTPSDPKSDVEN